MPTPITLPARRSLPSAIYGDDEPVLAGVTVSGLGHCGQRSDEEGATPGVIPSW